MKTKMLHLLHLFVSSLFAVVLSLYVVVYSLFLVDVHCLWYEISVFVVVAVLNRDENDELVDRQIP